MKPGQLAATTVTPSKTFNEKKAYSTHKKREKKSKVDPQFLFESHNTINGNLYVVWNEVVAKSSTQSVFNNTGILQ